MLASAGNAVPNGDINQHADGANGNVNGHAEPSSQPKPSLRLSFSEYKRISNLLVLHLRRAEEGRTSLPLHCPAVSVLLSLLIARFNVFTDCLRGRRGRGGAEEECGGELVSEGDRVGD